MWDMCDLVDAVISSGAALKLGIRSAACFPNFYWIQRRLIAWVLLRFLLVSAPTWAHLDFFLLGCCTGAGTDNQFHIPTLLFLPGTDASSTRFMCYACWCNFHEDSTVRVEVRMYSRWICKTYSR